MENNKENPFPIRQLTEAQIADFRLEIRHFFLNNGRKRAKKNIWRLFRGWTYNMAECGDASEVADMLLFVEQLEDFVERMK